MDSAVLGRVLSGDREAYRDVVLEHTPMLLAYAGFRVPDRDLVDEVVQQTFIRAYEQLADFKVREDFGIWLRTIASYMIKAELKRQMRSRRNLSKYSEHLRQQVLEAASEHDHGEQSDAHAILAECMGRLEATAERMVCYRYQENRSVNEIAERLGRTVTWVTSTLFRIRRTLRECIQRRLAAGTP